MIAEVNRAILESFREQDIEISFPQREIRMFAPFLNLAQAPSWICSLCSRLGHGPIP